MPDWIQYRKGVPGGSRVEARAESNGVARVDLAIVSTGEDDGHFPPGAVDAGQAIWPVVALEVYLFKARIVFVQSGDATVEMTVKRPDGAVHSTPAVWEASGDPGDVALCSLIVQTA